MKKFFAALLLVLVFSGPVRAACVFNVAGTTVEAASGNLTLGAPASPATNDIWIALVNSRDNVAHTFTDWTNFINTTHTVSIQFTAWYFRYAGSTPNLIVTHTAGSDIIGGIVQLRGCDTVGTPIDTVGTLTNGTNTDTVTYATITPATSNTLLLALAVSNDNAAMTTDPAGFGVGFEAVGSTGSFPVSAYAHHLAHVSGATGAFTGTIAGGAVAESVGVLVAVGEIAAAFGPLRRRGQ